MDTADDSEGGVCMGGVAVLEFGLASRTLSEPRWMSVVMHA